MTDALIQLAAVRKVFFTDEVGDARARQCQYRHQQR